MSIIRDLCTGAADIMNLIFYLCWQDIFLIMLVAKPLPINLGPAIILIYTLTFWKTAHMRHKYGLFFMAVEAMLNLSNMAAKEVFQNAFINLRYL